MSIPNYQEFMNPVLELYLKINSPAKTKDIEKQIADNMKISNEDRLLTIKSGLNSIIFSRIFWASYYMYRAGLLEKPSRGFYKITDEGKKVLNKKITINDEFLLTYPSFADFIAKSNNYYQKDIQKKLDKNDDCLINEDPETKITNAIYELNSALEDDILTSLKSIDPKIFEQVVVNLMEAMDYGIGKTTRYVADGGVDGIIDEDELGLSKIYLQAKRYSDGKVNEKEMRDFVGALATNNVNKGVFITTSHFSEKAISTANNARNHIIRLIDGPELSKLMIKHNLGVKLKKGYEIKELDNSFFE